MNFRAFTLSAPLFALSVAGCAAEPDTNSEQVDDITHNTAHHVFTSSNAVAGNTVVSFARAGDGTLTPMGETPTGGAGTGGGLGSQGALALSENGRVLVVVNAGSNDVSSFAISSNGALTLKSRVPSNGIDPVSVAISGNLVYVLNAGDGNSISGFTLDSYGRLAPISTSKRLLSGSKVGAAEIAFTPDGSSVVVTEKATNRIDTFEVRSSGRLNAVVVSASAGTTPFGFAFTSSDQLVVSEASGGAAGAGTVSSYMLQPTVNGSTPALITGPVANQQSAPCWIAITENDRYAYASNTASGNVSGYTVNSHGKLALFADGGVTGDTGDGSKPTDMALDTSSHHLYVLGSGSHTLVGFTVATDGSLEPLGASVTLPEAAVGLVAM